MPEWFPGGCERRQVYRSHSRCVLRLASDTGLSTVRLPRKLRAAVPLRVVERTSALAGVGRHGWVQTILPLGKTLQSEPMDTFETTVKISRGPDAMQLRDNRWRLNVYRWERAQDPGGPQSRGSCAASKTGSHLTPSRSIKPGTRPSSCSGDAQVGRTVLKGNPGRSSAGAPHASTS